MKNLLIAFLSLCIVFQLQGQKLGFSSLTPYGGSNEKIDNHTLYFNTGEMLISEEALNGIF